MGVSKFVWGQQTVGCLWNFLWNVDQRKMLLMVRLMDDYIVCMCCQYENVTVNKALFCVEIHLLLTPVTDCFKVGP